MNQTNKTKSFLNSGPWLHFFIQFSILGDGALTMQGRESLSHDYKNRPQLSQGEDHLNLIILQEKWGKSIFIQEGNNWFFVLSFYESHTSQLRNAIFWLKWLSPSSEAQEE